MLVTLYSNIYIFVRKYRKRRTETCQIHFKSFNMCGSILHIDNPNKHTKYKTMENIFGQYFDRFICEEIFRQPFTY